MTIRMGLESGSIMRHLLLLLALGGGCYFGVKALYHQVDSRLMNRSASPDVFETADVSDRSAEPAGQVDREAITRKNIFLPKKSSGQGDYATDLMESLKRSQGDLVLVGTIVEKGSGRRAVIFDVANEKQSMLKEGDVINGASIRQISSGKVVISRQGENELLDISEARKLLTLTREIPKRAAVSEFSPDRSDENGDAVQTGSDSGLQIDMNRLGEIRTGVIVKGRISN